jgi:hypothetical protein
LSLFLEVSFLPLSGHLLSFNPSDRRQAYNCAGAGNMATTQGYPARRLSAWSVTLMCWLVVGALQFVELGDFKVVTGLFLKMLFLLSFLRA